MARFKLDVRGLICPYPVLKATVAMSKMEKEDVLEVLVTDPSATESIPAQGAERGYEAKVAAMGDGVWKITLANSLNAKGEGD